MTPTTTSSRGMRPLPQPGAAARLLQLAAIIVLLLTILGIGLLWAGASIGVVVAGHRLSDLADSAKGVATVIMAVEGGIGALVLWALSLLLHYGYHTAINVRMAERRQVVREDVEVERRGATGAAMPNEVVALLREINENTLLGDAEKARKRGRLSDERRERLKKEARQLIEATKWPAARTRIDELRAEYPDSNDVRKLRDELETAIKEHRDVDIVTTSEQIRSYMSLGLWEKARQTAKQLADKYPDNPEAQKMGNVVVMEEDASQKEDRLRLYREIEHLVARKHYRDAKRTASVLLERYPESPESAMLKGQMAELLRNADIETRREMEAQIIEFTKQNRHKEAYEVAQTLMEQFPESPQAVALRDQIDKLREKAGIS